MAEIECVNRCGNLTVEGSEFCEDCTHEYDCKKCKDTGIITVIHGEDGSEWEEDYGCECHEDLNKGITR
jgi:hypothetical protein